MGSVYFTEALEACDWWMSCAMICTVPVCLNDMIWMGE